MAIFIDPDRLSAEIATALKSTAAPQGVSAGSVLLAVVAITRHIAQNSRSAHDELDARMRELEGAIPRYVGTFKAGEQYAKNAIVTDRGSMWIALRDTSTRPPGADWQQCVRGVRS